MLKSFLDAALEAELESRLDEVERSSATGRMARPVKRYALRTVPYLLIRPVAAIRALGPELIRKRETILAESLESKIIGMYGLGMSLRDISKHIKDMYDTEISHSTLSAITDKIIPEAKEWQSRPLDGLYTIVWLDAMHYKVKEDHRTVSHAVYNILGIYRHGHKELPGMYVSQSGCANFWLSRTDRPAEPWRKEYPDRLHR